MKSVDRDRGAILALSRFPNLARCRVLYRSKPISTPFQTRLCPFIFPFLVFLVLLTYHIQIHATFSPIIGPRQTIIDPWDQWEVCIHGDEMLGTSLRDMYAPVCGCKRSRSGTNLRALDAQHTKKKRSLIGLNKRSGKGGGADTQLQVPTGVIRS